MKVYNRLLRCTECGSRLWGDKSPYTSDQGFIYRTRTCRYCSCVFYTKQAPEELTGKERAEKKTLSDYAQGFSTLPGQLFKSSPQQDYKISL